MTTIALLIGLIVANVFKPGEGMHVNVATLDTKSISGYINAGKDQSFVAFLMNIIPKTFVGAFAEGEILQVLLLAIIFGAALARIGKYGAPVLELINNLSRAIFGMVGIVTRFAPLGAFGAMGFTIGKFGVGALLSLGQLLLCVYLTCFLFIALVLGTIARLAGFNFWRVLKFAREEIFIAVGTSSSEAALPSLMAKMEKAGCSREVVGVVVPAGYSFNLDGTCIYLTCSALFVAQATDTPLTLGHQIWLLIVMLLTSKGAAGITGSGFIVLAGTLETTGHVPAAGLAIIYGIDRFMSEIRTLTNIIGNTVATLVISKWDGSFDSTKAKEILAGKH